jgi:hypothetical protein
VSRSTTNSRAWILTPCGKSPGQHSDAAKA